MNLSLHLIPNWLHCLLYPTHPPLSFHPIHHGLFRKIFQNPQKQMNTHHFRRDFPVYMNFTLNIYFIFGTPVCLYIQWISFYFILFIWFVFCKIYLYMIYLLHFDVYIFFFIHIYMVRIIQSHASECSVLLSFPKSIIKMRRIG